MTIDDIADALGVSKTTVSRAISGKGRISKATTERVLSYIDEHNYTPNINAQGLAQRKTFNIGVVWPADYSAVDLPFFQKCLMGINGTAAEQGYDLLVSMIEGDDIAGIRRIVENHKVDGVILTRTLVHDAPAAYLKGSGIPFVAIGHTEDPEIISVDNANEKACEELTGRMLGEGIRRIALIGGNSGHVISCIRRSGFENAFRRSGRKADQKLIFMDAEDRDGIGEDLSKAVGRGAEAVICMDDRIAGNVLLYCRDHSVRIPEDLKLASFYDSSLLDTSKPSVTSLQFDDKALGAAACGSLIRLMAGEKVGSSMLENYRIVFRESFR